MQEQKSSQIRALAMLRSQCGEGYERLLIAVQTADTGNTAGELSVSQTDRCISNIRLFLTAGLVSNVPHQGYKSFILFESFKTVKFTFNFDVEPCTSEESYQRQFQVLQRFEGSAWVNFRTVLEDRIPTGKREGLLAQRSG